jgi:hypothetical protein
MLGEFAEGTSIEDIVKCKVVFSGEVYNQDGSATVVKTKAFEFEFQQYE